QLQAKVQAEEAVGAVLGHPAEAREQQQGEELAAQQAAVDEVLARVDQRRPDREVGHQLEQVRQRVGDEQPVEQQQPRIIGLALHEKHVQGGKSADQQDDLGEAEAGVAPLGLDVQIDD